MKKGKKKILFLYTELAGYFLACVSELQKQYDAEVHVVRYPVNDEAPFVFSPGSSVFFYEREKYNYRLLQELAVSISPDCIYCSGWIDRDYVRVCKSFGKKIPVVLALDNQWKGSLRQHLASLFFRPYIQKIYTHVWIPGSPQDGYASRLGFGPSNIMYGVYSIAHSAFNGYYTLNRELKESRFPKKFLYVGRYLDFKGVRDLWHAFIELQYEMPNSWELWCAGTGPLEKDFPVHPQVKNLGFVQPSDIGRIIAQTGVFVLPSHFEPWGVVVHEFAAAGMPLLCSSEVGAVSHFLRDGDNGFVFKSGDVRGLKRVLRKIVTLPVAELSAMGRKSTELAASHTPGMWAEKIMALCANRL